ncbi:tripartite tricarboxylate transporter substrate binding protein [Brucella anthropi]|uniref:tripartite tricarboxylate transporter substrate binding protein n=1 Tax=Brucella anthropi TaxID=529 RepID=UPI00124DC982|nr:tripartite tricarboxylate transporter substrate binding protein [Brucella anthropi]KAB2786140.1 tripartite tricarboxylate transporter substrate binding protein [Brucella anthropi]
MRRREFLAATAFFIGAGHRLAWSATKPYPADNPMLIVGFAAGGAGDIASRVVTSYVKRERGLVATPDFRPGAGGTIATDQVRRASPDGSVLSLYSVSPVLVAPHLQKVPYDATKDFTYIASYAGISVPCFVRKDSPHQTWDQLLDFCRNNPSKLKWATAAPRGLAHIATDAAFRKEKAKATFVPFRGGADAVTALLGGHIDMVVSSDFGPHLAAGSVRLLAETSPNPQASPKGIVSFAERGYPIAIPASYGLFGPTGMPSDIVSWWEEAIGEMVSSPMYADFLKLINGYPLFQKSEEFTSMVKEAYTRIGSQIETMEEHL